MERPFGLIISLLVVGGYLTVNANGQQNGETMVSAQHNHSNRIQYLDSNGLPVLVQFTYTGPPKILPIATADSYPEGTSINLICTVTGGQRKGLVLSWKLNDKDLNEETLRNSRLNGHFENNISIGNDETDISFLRIKNANYSNSGLYTCVARNPLGQDSTSVKIVINGLYLR